MASTTFIDTDGVVDPSVTNGFFPPVSDEPDKLLGYYEFDGTLTQASINLANPGLSALPVGAPTMASDGISLTGSTGYLDTQIAQPTLWTIFAVVKTVGNPQASPNRHVILSNIGARGMAFYLEAQSPAAGVAGSFKASVWTSTGGVESSTATSGTGPYYADATAYALLMAQYDGSQILLCNLTTGWSGARTGVSNTPVLGTNTLRIGAGAGALGYEGAIKQKRLVIYGSALTPAKVDTMTAFLRADMAALATPIPV